MFDTATEVNLHSLICQRVSYILVPF